MNIDPKNILIRDYSYDLPNEKIAHYPLPQRDASRLLVYRDGQIIDQGFRQLADHLPENATIVFNNTRVIEARLHFQKSTGGVIEIFCLEPHEQSIEQALQQQGSCIWKCLIGGASKWKPGQVLEKELDMGVEPTVFTASFIGKEEEHFLIRFNWTPSHFHFVELLHAAGAIPLPPYIKRSADAIDWERYQTVFSKAEGSVAAPTAALHFTEVSFASLAKKNIHPAYLTLHVGAGTFKPVKSESLADHHMHGEPFSVTLSFLRQIRRASSLIAVGTTSMRTLESLYWLGLKVNDEHKGEWELEQWEAYALWQKHGDLPAAASLDLLINYMERNQLEILHCRTSLIIVPGYQFHFPDALITNFHQPQSTLILLVAAFVGDDWRDIYQHALTHDYRFLSYGDSSLLWRKK